jgi:hypothetical protein
VQKKFKLLRENGIEDGLRSLYGAGVVVSNERKTA